MSWYETDKINFGEDLDLRDGAVWVARVWFKGKSRDLALGGDYWATEHPPSIWMHLSHPLHPFLSLFQYHIILYDSLKT